MEFSAEFWVQIMAYLVSIGAVIGSVKTNIKYLTEKIDKLEVKQDKHNSLVERMVIVEQSTKSAHYRLDEMSRDKGE